MSKHPIAYVFRQNGATLYECVVQLDEELSPTGSPRVEIPDWVGLDHHQCPGCPLTPTAGASCPMALALIDLVNFSAHLDSFAELEVVVTTPEREIRFAASAQRALSSLMGLLIATSGCPDVNWLRPMGRFHLPGATEEETIFRAASAYLLAHYFEAKRGTTPDWTLTGLRARYQRLHDINVAMARRLRSAVAKDASVNAVILLDLLAKAMPWSLDDSLADIEHLFPRKEHIT